MKKLALGAAIIGSILSGCKKDESLSQADLDEKTKTEAYHKIEEIAEQLRNDIIIVVEAKSPTNYGTVNTDDGQFTREVNNGTNTHSVTYANYLTYKEIYVESTGERIIKMIENGNTGANMMLTDGSEQIFHHDKPFEQDLEETVEEAEFITNKGAGLHQLITQ